MESQLVPFAHALAPFPGQVSAPHAPAAQVTSQAHELLHLTVPQAAAPVQVTRQRPVLQVMLPQAASAEQVMSQP